MRLGRRIGLFAAAALMLAALPPAAQAALKRTVSVTINSVACGSACDGQGIEGPLDGEPDWFARVFIDGGPANPPRLDGPDDRGSIRPNWVFTKVVPDSQQNVDVRIQIWDRDDGSDDLADSTPQIGDKNLDFTIDTLTNAVSGEIGGAVGAQLCTFGNGDDSDGSAFVCFTAGTGDRDGDGLQDVWETNGIDFDEDGIVDLPLNAAPFNANPDHKDLYMEIDYMDCAAGGCAAGDAHSHKPQNGVLQDVVDAFANAPVGNPDLDEGITLHAMEDEAVAERTQVLFQSNGPGPNDDFNDIKNGSPTTCNRNGRFGTSAERGSANCTAILAAKRAVFQYVVFGHSYTEAPGSSGISELDPKGGNDLMVTLGGFGAGGIAANGGQRPSEASTLMHEYGHNLGLGHGGFEGKNCKPNYLSIMSYAFQFANIDNARPMDYSTDALPMLDETALPTTGGVGGPAGRNTIFGRGGNAVVAPANGPIDWDGSGGTTGDVDFIQTINPGCQNPSPGDKNMRGWDDWASLVYNFRLGPMFADGASRTSAVEITNDTVIAMTPLADLNAAKVVDRTTAQPGDTLGYTVTARNAGPGAAVGVEVTDTLPDGTSQERTIGGLAANGSSVQSFPYAIPCQTADGVTLTNTATVAGTNRALVADPSQADNTATASTTVQAPKVTLSKSASSAASAGAAIAYTITYANAGTAGATNVVITDVVPAEVYYSLALDQGSGPRPDTVVGNADGTTTLTWNVGSVAALSGPHTIAYTARPSLLVLGGSSIRNGASVSFANVNGCAYAGPSTSAATSVTAGPPSRDPLSQGYWGTHPEEWTAEILARIQATDQRYDGADGSTPDGLLSPTEVAAAFAPPGGTPRVTLQQLLAVYFNLATRRINASTAISSKTTTRLGLTNVRAAALYAKATLALPVSIATSARYADTTQVLDEINRNRSEAY
jgi:uncharacterized repeat protein (TIGR01451 family)